MGILSKNLRYSLVNVVRRRGYNNLSLLLQRRDADGTDRFTLLSTEEEQGKIIFSPKQDLYPPCAESCNVESSDCSNGLLFLNYGRRKLVVWNPSTDKYKVLPRTTSYVPSSLALRKVHELRFSVTYFGFDPSCNDYKIYRMFDEFIYGDDDIPGDLDFINSRFEVYSLKNDFWKEVRAPESCPLRCSVLINGYCYWSCWKGKNLFGSHILRYDFAKEEYTFLPLPDMGGGLVQGYRLELLELDGLLSVVVYPRLGVKKWFRVWIRMNESWIEKPPIPMSGAERPLGFWREGQFMFFKGLNHELMVFDRTTQETKNLGIYGYPDLMAASLVTEPDRTMKLFSLLNNPLPLSEDQA